MPRPIHRGWMQIDQKKAAPILVTMLAWITGLILADVPRIR